MSVSLSRLERHSPPPRGKSCTPCIKAKRRCDRELPKCARCASRQLACEYPKRASRRAQRPVQRLAGGHDSCAEGIVRAGTPGDFDDLDSHGAVVPYYEHGEAMSSQAAELQIDAVSDILRTIERSSANDLEAPGFSAFFENDPLFGMGLGDLDFNFHDPPMSLVNGDTQLCLQPGSFDVEAVTKRMERDWSYAVDQIKSAPRTMLLETQTPWCHVSLYKRTMPRTMQVSFRALLTFSDALSACALYESKNAVNSPVIIRCINTRVTDFLQLPLPTDPLDVLAHTQSLLLYQIMRFFDGDIIARSSADATFSQLDSSTRLLYKHIHWNSDDRSRDLSFSRDGMQQICQALQAASDFWCDWTFQESARRTYLVARFFLHIWRLLTGQQAVECRGAPPPPNRLESWTLSAHLWQASDSADFAAAWAEKKHYVVKRKEILSTLADARCEDLETFGKMILTTSMGVSEAEIWLASIGVTL